MFYLVILSALSVEVFTSGLRNWSLKQDEPGSTECTYKMRYYSYWGILRFAVTLTLIAIMLVKALEHEWFSTMYGVIISPTHLGDAGRVYVITGNFCSATASLKTVVTRDTFYYISVLLICLHVCYA